MRNVGPFVSVVINNYNYGRFLRDAIESALGQTYPNTEVIVVDDGSTDNSREIIAGYGSKVIPVLKGNGGHASAFNAGFSASKGDFVYFLDSDDFFYPEKVASVQELVSSEFAGRRILLYHLLDLVDESGRREGSTFPSRLHECEPNLFEHARKYGFAPLAASPTSGLMIERSLAERIFPVPEVRISADDFVVRAASLLGEVYGISETLGAYRRHGSNNWLNSQRPKPKEFIADLEAYLNLKLVENHFDPVIDFYGSGYSLPYAEGSFSRLSRLSWAVLRRTQDSFTVRFFLKTEYKAFKCLLKGGF